MYARKRRVWRRSSWGRLARREKPRVGSSGSSGASLIEGSGCFPGFDFMGAKVGRGLAWMQRLEKQAIREVVVTGPVGVVGVAAAPPEGAWDEWWAVLGPVGGDWGLEELAEAVGTRGKYFCRYLASIFGSMR